MTVTNEEAVAACVRSDIADPGGDTACPLIWQEGVIDNRGDFVSEQSFKPGEYFLNPGFLVVQLGADKSEIDRRIDFAYAAVTNSIGSLFANCEIRVDSLIMHTYTELEKTIEHYRGALSHVIIIGHGSKRGVKFLDKDRPVTGKQLGKVFECLNNCPPIQVVSLCCHSGCEEMAQQISKVEAVSDVIAPDGAFHADYAVHFTTGYMLEYFLNGQTVDAAVKKAVMRYDKTPMCVWRDGKKSCDASPAKNKKKKKTSKSKRKPKAAAA